jgi:hypothetical protein
MNNESLVHNLYKFLKEGVTTEKMNEANVRAYPVVGIQKLDEGQDARGERDGTGPYKDSAQRQATGDMGKRKLAGEACPKGKQDEGKLPKDPSLVEDPDGDIQLLSEKEKKTKKVTQKSAEKEADGSLNKDIETAGAGKTDEPELTDLQKEAAKETPVDKLTQNKDGEDPLKAKSKTKEEKKITPEVTGVTKESKLPDDPSQIKDPIGDVEKLAEDKVLTTVSDEKVAKDISQKYPGSRIVADKTPDGKNQFIVMVKESREKSLEISEILNSILSGEFGLENAQAIEDKIMEQFYIKKIIESKKEVKEDVTVTVDDGNKSTTITSTEDGGTTITTTDKPAVEEPVVVDEPVVEEDPDVFPGETEWSDEETDEMAEKIEVADYLATLSQLSEKQKKFKEEIKGKKIGKKNKAKLAAKKDKKEKK